MVLGALLLAALAIAFPLPNEIITESATESGPVESAQMLLWLLAAGLSMLAALAPRAPRRDRWLRLWICIFSLQAAFREADAHERLNPDRMGDLGVSFRLDWWADAAVPIWLKLVWALIFAAAVGGLIMPLVFARVPFIRLGLRGHLAVQCMAMAAVCLVLGYAADDLLGRDQFVSKPASKTAEELLELAGVLFWVVATVLWVSSRIPALKDNDS